MFRGLALVILVVISGLNAVSAETTSFLEDRNGDEEVIVLVYGDSIVFGVGDGQSPGGEVTEASVTDGSLGPAQRIAAWAGVRTINAGQPGELLTEGGLDRFIGVVGSSGADVVVILEGANDAIFQLSASAYRRALQRLVNVGDYLGIGVVVATLPVPCCNRAGVDAFTENYSRIARDISVVNGIGLADVERAWYSTCERLYRCQLLNLPEGLHPNSLGYDVLGQVMVATLVGVDIFAQSGAADLESALGLPEGTVVVVPDEVVILEEE